MVPISLKTIFKAWGDALDRRDSGSGYVYSGMTPSAHGAGTLQVDVAAGVYARNADNVRRVYGGGNIALTAAHAIWPRVDIVYMSSAGVLTKSDGVASVINPVPPAWPAGSCPLAICFVGPTSVDLTVAPSYVFDTTITKATAMTTLGDLLKADVAGFPMRLPLGAALQQLRVNAAGTDLEYAAIDPNPNLILNADFGRSTVLGLAMPEPFADLNGTTKLDGGAAGAVAANIFTQGAANNEYAWCAAAFGWRDGRASATFKAIAVAGIYELRWRTDATHYVSVKQNNGNFTCVLANGGAPVVQTTTGLALTLNRWYWLEIEIQNQTVIVRLYDTGGVAAGVTKAASVLLQVLTVVNLGVVQTGAHISITSDQAAAQWGGIAASPGGVYLETWLPESWAPVIFQGTLGGQAICYDDSVDAGPLGKQWAMRVYIPHASRGLTVAQPNGSSGNTAYGTMTPSGTYTGSTYYKIAGKGGVGSLMTYYEIIEITAAGADNGLHTVDEAGSAVWARLSATVAIAATTRGFRVAYVINAGLSATGTVFFSLPQLEQGPAATAWRSAPADDAPIVFTFVSNRDDALAADGEINPRDLAGNIRVPWDASLVFSSQGVWANSGANSDYVQHALDGAAFTAIATNLGVTVNSFATISGPGLAQNNLTRVAAGKHRVALKAARAAGTVTFYGATYAPTIFTVTAYRGK